MASEYPPPGDRSPPLSEHAARTRAMWDEDAPNWIESGRRKWAAPAPLWGAWEFPLVHGSAESAPLPDASFDLAFSEYGAATWCDPYLWIPEAHRLLRPGGWLIFLRDSALASLCYPPSEEPVGETLVRPQLGLKRIDWPDGETDFHLPHGPMVALLRQTGFQVEALHELYAPEGPADEVRYYMRRGWARRWPAEDLWIARRPPD